MTIMRNRARSTASIKWPKQLGTDSTSRSTPIATRRFSILDSAIPRTSKSTDGGKTSIFDKSGENWMSGGKKMDSTSVQAFADRLRDLAATKFADTGFTTPALTITVASNQGKLREKVEIAPAAAGGNFLARRGWRCVIL